MLEIILFIIYLAVGIKYASEVKEDDSLKIVVIMIWPVLLVLGLIQLGWRSSKKFLLNMRYHKGV